MIVFELICAARHRFEGWFSSAEDFNAQSGRRLIACPQCGDDSVRKLPSARIRKAEAAAPKASVREPARGTRAAQPAGRPASMNELIDFVLMNTEDVGAEFVEEARRMHREEAPRRDIRGTATGEQALELLNEGIAVMPLPVPPKGEWQ
jgi:hypothetical protein